MNTPVIVNHPGPDSIQRFPNVLLDREGYLYNFQNDLPVFLQGAGLNKVGMAQLKLKRKKLYAAMQLYKCSRPCYRGLYPHLLHNTQGYIFGILLTDDTLQDASISNL
mgnify:CR=1 FL=1